MSEAGNGTVVLFILSFDMFLPKSTGNINMKLSRIADRQLLRAEKRLMNRFHNRYVPIFRKLHASGHKRAKINITSNLQTIFHDVWHHLWSNLLETEYLHLFFTFLRFFFFTYFPNSLYCLRINQSEEGKKS